MATKSKKTKAANKSQSRVSVSRPSDKSENFLDKIQSDLEKNQSYLNLILGALIVIVLGVLVFNYFNKPSDTGNLGPAQTTTDASGDVLKDNLPGKYKVKEGDTLFTIAEKYYNDGSKYTEIMKENSLTADSIEVDQELMIPKLEVIAMESDASPSASASSELESSPIAMESPTEVASPFVTPSPIPAQMGEKGAMMDSWGAKIQGDTYTVQAGDWLSTIAGRAYGDIMQYEKIAQANNIANPNVIEVGTVLKLPRN